jgi:hypothetical protein
MKALLITCLAFAAMAGEVKLGKPLVAKETTAIDKLVAAPDRYVGKLVQVKGTVRDVCRHMGCWTEIADAASGKSIRIKVKDGEIVFPKESIGKTIIAEGKLAKVDQTYQIQGTGAVIVE